ncbi:MAG: class II aldolase/adducin family protein [Pirellulaceae bacterium]|nr:class II aldolase/adducin family protein [Pirellulaceae bacterium]
MSDVLEQLIGMSQSLGEPANDYVILGEGNTSVRADDDSFWVKASGTELVRASRDSFVRVRFAPILEALDGAQLTDAEVKQLLKTVTVEGARAPSIETFLHALCLQLEGIQFVGHTHPVAAVSLLCSQHSRELFSGSLFPDQIVLLGPAFVYVPYTDPGLPLALAVRDGVRQFVETQRRVPKVLMMENHGVFALGGTAQEVLNITQMLVKTCRILTGTLAAGGPRFLSPGHVARIDQRPDELARRRGFG